MPINIRDAGTWKNVANIYVRDAGTWKTVQNGYVRDGGAWKEFYANAFNFTVSSNTSNFNLRSAAVAAGWNQSSALICTINSGVILFSTSTGTPACTINGSFPGGVTLINNGTILGRGGNGGSGYRGAGASGGLGLLVQSAVSINNANRISGGGGGGGAAGQMVAASCREGKVNFDGMAIAGGGGGIGGSTGGAGTQTLCAPSGPSGGSGTLTSPGGSASYCCGVSSGAGGTYGSSGGNGQYGNDLGGNGGSGGAAVSGNSNITWIATGTRNGAIS